MTAAKRKAPPRKLPTRQLYNTTWIPVAGYDYDVCCGCGLVHRVFYRWNAKRLRFEERWVALTTQPKKRKSKPRKGK